MKTKRIVAMLLAMLTCLYIFPVASSAAYENTYTNTGNAAADLIGVANTQVGYMEGTIAGTVQGNNNCTKYGEWYGMNYNSWCAMFVSWCAKQAGISTAVIPKHASCDIGVNWFKSKNLWKEGAYYGGTYTPVPGDIVYFGTRSSTTFDSTHVGIVYAVDSSAIYTIEGNSSNKVVKNSHSLTDDYILGYGVPIYNVSGDIIITYGAGFYQVTASSLNVRATASTSSSAVASLAKGELVTVTEVNGKWGKVAVGKVTGWIYLEYCNRLYHLTFNANGGSGAPDPMLITDGDSIAVPGNVPTRLGMTFRGWSLSLDDANKGIVAYSSTGTLGGSAYITPGANMELYACWAYPVTLKPGNQGQGSSCILYKYPSVDLDLAYTNSTIKTRYSMYPNTADSQRYFIQWNTAQNSNGKGTGKAYRTKYTVNASTTLYAVWGYAIQYNADGGTFPSNGSDIFLSYVCGYDGVTYSDPRTLYGNFDFPHGSNTPTKPGCRLATFDDGTVYYLLLYSDGRVCTTETAKQNLTIPPSSTAGLNWSHFHTTTDANNNLAIEFYAAWEPSVTYKANGGTGSDYSEYLTYDWDYLYNYEDYTIMTKSKAESRFTRSGYTFNGWNTKADGSGISYAPGSVINQLDSSDPIVLYAQWKANAHTHSYTVKRTTEPTCVKEGIDTYTCSCGDSYTKAVAATGVHVYGSWTQTTAPDCESMGVETRKCGNCPATETQNIPALGHTWGEWIETTPPTVEREGVETRTCGNCGTTQTQSIPKLEVVEPDTEFAITVENYTVKMTNASKLDHIRYASGIYNTAAEIRNAEDVRNVNSTIIANGTTDDIFTYEMQNGGVYSFWIRFTDGTTRIEHLDFTTMSQSVSTEGLMLTVHNLYGVKDYFVGKGTYNSYRELKNGETVGRVTATKIAGAKSFTTILPDNGDYTVCVRYDDATRPDLMLYFSVEVDMPEIEVNGLQVLMSGLTDVRVIRTAPGTWETPGEVKRAEGARNIKGSALKGSDTLTLQYSAEGTYTLTLEYYNGLIVVKTFEIKQKEPTVEQNGNSVTFGDLDDMYIIRYAKGEYTTSKEIKNASGSKFKKPNSIVDGHITVDNLESGTYTFCVQYNDNSYNYYIIAVEEPVTEDVDSLDIASERQLMFDDYVIDTEKSDIEFVIGTPVKEGVVFTFDKSYETTDTVFHNIVTMPDGTYRMYYMATAGRRRICYLESEDGLTWTRPNLTTNTYNGEKYTNIVTNELVSPASLFVYWDTNPIVPTSDKLRGLYGQWGDGLFLEHTTTNGDFFEFWPNETKLMGTPAETEGCFFDTLNTVYWDDVKGKYYAFVRGFHDANGNYDLTREFVSGNYDLSLRDIRVSESTDGTTWTTPVPLTYSDGIDYQMYANCIIPYYRASQIYVGMPTRFILEGNNKYTDVFFMSSRDLYNWERSEEPFLAPNPGSKYIYPKSGYPCVGYIETAPGEMSFFMDEYNSGKKCDVLCRYTLRVDGFMSAEGTKLVTKPITFEGDSLEINYEGEIRVIMTDMAGNSVTSEWMTGDDYAKTVEFDGDIFIGKAVTLTFEMSNAKLYSFKFN